MGMLIWISEQDDEALDLGDPLAAWKAFSEMAKAAPGEEWPELYGVPHAAEHEVPADWLAKVRDQARRFLLKHGHKLGEGPRRILRTLAGDGGA